MTPTNEYIDYIPNIFHVKPFVVTKPQIIIGPKLIAQF